MAIDSYKGVRDIFLLEDLQLELKIRVSIIMEEGRKGSGGQYAISATTG